MPTATDPTLDDLPAIAAAIRRRCDQAADEARQCGGLYDPTLNRWIAWDETGPVTPQR